MKKYIMLALLVLLPVVSSAASVQVYPEITNAHGHQLYAMDLYTTISYDGGVQSQNGVPTYEIPSGNYTVTAVQTPYYTALLGDGCQGYIQENESKVCNIFWKDDGKDVVKEQQKVEAQKVLQQTNDIAGYTSVAQKAETISSDDDLKIQLLLQLLDLYKQLLALLQAQAIK